MANDPYWNSVVLAMHMDDTGLTDLKGHSVTLVGNAARSATQSRFGGYSAYFDGNGDYLSLADSADFDLGSVFTIEGWFYFNALPGSAANYRLVTRWDFMNAKRCYYLNVYNPSGTPQLMASISSDGGGTNVATATYVWSALAAGQWYHLAAVLTGTALLLFVNGEQVASTATTLTTFNTDRALYIGSMQGDIAEYFNGYMDDVRITKGVARYTADFTPATEAFPDTMVQIAGTVKDSTNSFAARTVRAYRRSDGALAGSATSNATTGAFSISALDNTAHYAVCLDDGTPDENALIFDNITPI